MCKARLTVLTVSLLVAGAWTMSAGPVSSGPLDYVYYTTITYGQPDLKNHWWYDTGLFIPPGVAYALVPYGMTRVVSAIGGADAFGYGPEGAHSPRWPGPGENSAMNGAPHMALIGRVGDSGTPFFLGSQRRPTWVLADVAGGAGTLQLIVNDNLLNQQGWDDNEGTLWVDVYVPSTMSVGGSAGSVRPSASTVLGQNYPNPFNPSTTVTYEVLADNPVNLAVYDVHGRLVRVLVNERQAAGSYTRQWDGKNEAGAEVPSGSYLYELEVGGKTEASRMVLLR